MLDIHTHILPGIDDGAGSVEDALKILELQQAQGVTDLALTPHYYSGEESLDLFLRRRLTAYQQLKQAYRGDIRLYLGAEVYYSPFIVYNSSIRECCLGRSSCLLLELPYSEYWEDSLYRGIEELIRRYEITPVIAHIERYHPIRKKYHLAADFHDMGCLIQMNAGSLLDRRTTGLAQKLLKHDYIDLLASDTHSTGQRCPNLGDGLQMIADKYGKSYVRLLERRADRLLLQA